MTKAEWISVIQNTLKQGDETGYVRAPLIERHLQSVYEQMYNEEYTRSPMDFDRYTKVYTETPADGGALTNGHTLSNKPINLPRSTGGVFGLKGTGFISDYVFTPTTYQGYLSVTNTALSFDTVGVKGSYFYATIQDVLYANANVSTGDPGEEVIHDIEVRMIPKFTTLSATDEVLIVGGMEDHFIDRVIDTIRHMPPVDLLNDNA